MAANLYLPTCEPEIAVVINPAVGVPQTYYARFSRWLAENSKAAVLTYDYRDTGPAISRQELKRSSMTFSRWGIEDQSAALDSLIDRFPGKPVWVIGHSIGGFFLPWHRQADRVDRLIAIASGPAYFWSHPPGYIPVAFAFWHVIGPVATALLGYLPGNWLGLGEDLPAGVFWQWRRYCNSSQFHKRDWGGLLPVPDLERVKCDVDLVGISDDQMIPPKRVRKLAELYPAANVSYQEITPQQAGVAKIGHLKIFSSRCKRVWDSLVASREPVE